MVRASLIALGVLAFVSACSDSETGGSVLTSSGAGVVDNRYHPTPNQVAISEADACTRIYDAIQARKDMMPSCILTMQQCPAMLRSTYGLACTQYDEGTVDGCVEYFSKVSTCEELNPEDCALVGYPAGCEL